MSRPFLPAHEAPTGRNKIARGIAPGTGITSRASIASYPFVAPAWARSFLLLSLTLFLCPQAALALPPLQQPYRLHIVLDMDAHRLLTPVFQDRVERELRDTLRAALGELAHVELTREHPQLPAIRRHGLQHGLEGWAGRRDVKTHFVLIRFNGSEYEIQARQHDGTTGLVSPCVRRDATRDRDLVVKMAALLVAQDFGVLGTVQKAPDPQGSTTVELQGGGLASLAGWVRKGEVFALVPPEGGGQAVPWALLLVEEPPREEARDGLCTCRFFHRYQQARSLAGFHCIKLGTVRAPLRLRWMRQDARGKLVPLDGELSLIVALRHHGFTGEEATLLTRTVNEDGVVDITRDGERGLFDQVAFVSVIGGSLPEKQRPQVPVALVDDQPIVVPVSAGPSADLVLTFRAQAWQQNVADSLLVQITLFQELKALSAGSGRRGEVLSKAEQGLKRAQTDYDALQAEKAALLQQAASSRTPLSFTREEKRLRELKEGEKVLQDFVDRQRRIEAEENNPKTKAFLAQVEEGRLLEKDLEIDRALAVYKKVLDEGFKSSSLQEHYDQLRKRWEPRDARHREAREFVYRVWPKVPVDRLKERIAEARQAYLDCKRVDDVLTVRRLIKATEAHALQLTQELAKYHPELHIEDEKPARALKEASEELIRLADDLDTYVKEKGS